MANGFYCLHLDFDMIGLLNLVFVSLTTPALPYSGSKRLAQES